MAKLTEVDPCVAANPVNTVPDSRGSLLLSNAFPVLA